MCPRACHKQNRLVLDEHAWIAASIHSFCFAILSSSAGCVLRYADPFLIPFALAMASIRRNVCFSAGRVRVRVIPCHPNKQDSQARANTLRQLSGRQQQHYGTKRDSAGADAVIVSGTGCRTPPTTLLRLRLCAWQRRIKLWTGNTSNRTTHVNDSPRASRGGQNTPWT